MKRKFERGFVDIGVILLLVVLVIVAGIAWYAAKTQAEITRANQQASSVVVVKKTAAKKLPPTPKPTANWTSYSNAAGQFSFQYQPTWQKLVCADNAATVYLGPTAASLARCNSGFAGQMYVLSTAGDQRTQYEASLNYPSKASAAVTVAGVTGVRETATVDASPGLGPDVGTKLVQYLFFTNNRTYLCFYQQAPSGALSTNVLSDFDLAITTTLKFTP